MPPNVLLVVLDSVRAKNLGLHGHVHETTPFLSDFANEATVYNQARSAGLRSITGHASLFTGKNVEEHGLTNASQRLRTGTTIFETLQDEGYSTAVFSENVWITDVDIGLRNGFDTVIGPQNIPFPDAFDARRFVAEEGSGNYTEYIARCLNDDKPLRSLLNGVATKLSFDYPRLYPFETSAPGDVYVDRFLDWQANQDDAWGACINLMDAHAPYEPKDEYNLWGDEELRSLHENAPNRWTLFSNPDAWWRFTSAEFLYDGAIRQLDAAVERLVKVLRDRNELTDTLLVITSDHGEGFGEPCRVRPNTRVIRHNLSLHEVLLHVPLIVSYPNQSTSKRVSRLASTTGFPTAVRQILEDDPSDADPFITKTAYATGVGLDEDDQLRSLAARYQDIDSLDEMHGQLRAVYDDDGDTIVKRLSWEDHHAVKIRIHDAQNSCIEGEIEPEIVDTEFESLDHQTLVEDAAGVDAISQGTQKRLEDLGYM